jgi:hypothetical protein
VAKRPCVGFEDHAWHEGRGISPRNRLAVTTACESECARCLGRNRQELTVQSLDVGPRVVRWRCTEPGEGAKYCGFTRECTIVVISVSRVRGR